jgi:hypothetical protein
MAFKDHVVDGAQLVCQAAVLVVAVGHAAGGIGKNCRPMSHLSYTATLSSMNDQLYLRFCESTQLSQSRLI